MPGPDLPTLADTARLFFDRYRAKDVDGMIELFSPEGRIDYLPASLEGPATQAGRAIWSGLIDTFPDLTNEVQAIYPSADGKSVIAEVLISGTQAKDGFGIPNLGRRYALLHAFIIHGDDAHRITLMRAYWDNGAWLLALGKTSLA